MGLVKRLPSVFVLFRAHVPISAHPGLLKKLVHKRTFQGWPLDIFTLILPSIYISTYSYIKT